MSKKSDDNNFINFWLAISEMDILLQRSVISVFIPCHCLRTKELGAILEQLSNELIVCSQYKVFGVSIEERYPTLYQDLQTIHESLAQLQVVLYSQCKNTFTRLYHSLLNFRSCILYFRWREGWFYPEEMLHTSFSVFSMFNPVYYNMLGKDVLNDFEWKGIGRLVQVAWAERELMSRTLNLISDLKKSQINQIVEQSLYCLNEMEYAVSVKSKNHFQRNYEALIELYNPLHTQLFVKS